MRRIRTALIGCGKVGRTHASALVALAQSRFVAVCDRDGGRAAAFGEEFHVAAYSDVREMIREREVEAVCVTTPHPVHAAPAVTAAECGAHVLVEKPMAVTLEDCDAMIQAADRAGVMLSVVSQRRLYEPVRRMKAAIDAGKIGRPVLATAVLLGWRDHAYYESDPWRGKWASEGGGVLVNQAPHTLDLLGWFMGEVAEVSGYWGNMNHPGIEVEDTAVAIVRFESGGLGSLVLSNSQNPGLYARIHVHGENGASVGVQTDGGSTFVAGVSESLEPPVNDIWTIPGEENLLEEWQEEDRRAFRAVDTTTYYHRLQIEDFLRAVIERREPMVTAIEGRKTVEIFDAVYRSEREGKPVSPRRPDAAGQPGVTQASGDTPLYETFELALGVPGVEGNRFRKFGSVVFSKGGRSVAVDAFFDGDDTWRARFMPDEEGQWSYRWELAGAGGEGDFSCTPRANPDNHGHVRVDASHARCLICDDGTPHYWFGGKWIAEADYGPASKGGETNEGYLDDETLLSYLDTCREYRHNGLLLKIALYGIENDKFSWDLEWIRRGELLVREMAARGIYCQVNFFDTWSRDGDKWFETDTSGEGQVFNVWADGDEDAKENYIRTIVARFGGFYNVYWELGNEMEHAPNSGDAFALLANKNYLPWIRRFDPYGLPIGLSETELSVMSDIDIVFMHQTGEVPGEDRPSIINELVRGGVGGDLWQDDVIRSSADRIGYRRTFWRIFTRGGCGSSEATWLKLNAPLSQPVFDVMADQMRLRDFIEALGANINEMDPDDAFVLNGPGTTYTRSKPGECYVTYFLLEPEESAAEGVVTLSLAAGSYGARWYDPKTGEYSTPVTLEGAAEVRLHQPAFTEDIVLCVAETTRA